MDDPDSVHQIFTKLTRGDQRREIPIGGGNHAHVDGVPTAVRADRLSLPALEESQQERLHARTHLSDLIEENRASMRLLELSDSGHDGHL